MPSLGGVGGDSADFRGREEEEDRGCALGSGGHEATWQDVRATWEAWGWSKERRLWDWLLGHRRARDSGGEHVIWGLGRQVAPPTDLGQEPRPRSRPQGVRWG